MLAGSWKAGNGMMGCLHWSRVTDGLSELASYLVLRRKVDLLEQLWRNGETAGRLDLPQRIIGVMAVVKVVAC